MLSSAVLVLTTAMVVGQADQSSGYEHLKFFEAYMGSWSRQGPLEEDTSFGKKGDVGTSTVTWKWAYNKSAVDWEWRFTFAGKRSGTKGTLAWDPSQKKIVGSGVFSNGGLIRATVLTTTPCSCHVEFVAPDGKTSSQVETYAINGDNTMTASVTERKGTPTTEDSPKFVFTRGDSPERQVKLERSPLQQYGEQVVGRWVGDVTLIADWPGLGKKGDKLVAYMTIRWAADKAAVEMDWIGGNSVSKGLNVWDSSDKRIRFVNSDSLGMVYHGTMSRSGRGWAWELKGSLKNGTPFEQKGTITLGDGGKTYTIEGDGTMGGEKLDHLRDVYRRIQD